MQVKLAKTAGFCMGVRLAMDKVLALAEKDSGPVYTHGPLIHNRQAVERLEAMGIRDFERCDEATCGTVLIRAHGVPKQVAAELREGGLEVVDATCPRVLASQRKVERRAGEGYSILIAGDRDHAEVVGLVSHAGERCARVSTVEEAEAVELDGPVCLLAQTTFNEALYGQIAEAVRRLHPDAEVVQSICKATHERQSEVRELATEVEAMVVVGGRHSANTARLAELARSSGTPTFHVETADELDVEALAQFTVVGLTAGASTPNWVTRSVLQALEDIGRPVPRVEWLPWRALAALTRSNFYSAMAAVALTYASCQIAGFTPHPVFLVAAFCYIFAVTTLNRVAVAEGDERYLPPRVAFYHRHMRPLLAISLLFGAGSILGLQLIGAWRAMALYALAYLMGVAYSVRLVPERWRRLLRYARLKDVPASKDLFVALAWMVVCVLAPWLQQGGERSPVAVVVACAFAFVLTFVKATIIDLGDMQEDYLQGRETLPIVMGEGRTRRLLVAMALTLGLLLVVTTAVGWTPSVGWLMVACAVYLLVGLWVLYEQVVASDVLCALVGDGALLLAGVLAAGWALL